MAAGSSKAKETRINEPVQLYLAHRRLARAQLEIQIYTRLLQKELGPSLEKRTLFSLVLHKLFKVFSRFRGYHEGVAS